MSSSFEAHVTNGPVDDGTTPSPESDRRRRLEAQANVVRARLIGRVDALRSRARELGDPSADLKRHPLAVAVAIATLGVLVGASGGVVASRIANRKARAHRAMWDAFMPVFRQPVQVEVQKGIVVRAIESGLVGIVVAALTTVTKAYVGKMLEKDPPKKLRYALASPDPFPAPPHK